MVKLISLLTLLFLLNSSLFTQNIKFKPVNTPQDVIDNYITSLGGKENLKKINIVKLEGKVVYLGAEMNLIKYIGKDFLYMKLYKDDYVNITAYDHINGKGWYAVGNNVNDFDQNALDYYKLHSISNWGLYLDAKKLNVSYSFSAFGGSNDTNLYCVDISVNMQPYISVYFNKSDFCKVKTEQDGIETFFNDYREIDNSGIKMPYLISASDTLMVSGYEFNPKFDKKLLDKESLE